MKPFLTVIMLLVSAFSAQAAAKTCAFGEDVFALKKNTRFKIKEIGYTFKLSREKNPSNPLLWMLVSEVQDTKTNRVYHMNTTNHDQYDGGNTLGWIEDVTNADDGVDDENSPNKLRGPGEVIAEVQDSWIICNRDFK